MAGGTIRSVVAAVEHFHGWPWVTVNGFSSLLLGITIRRHSPESAFWVIGLFVGIDMMFSGWSWVMLAIGIRGALAGRACRAGMGCPAEFRRVRNFFGA